MAVFDDFDGVFFTIQSLRLANQDLLDDLDILVIDNNPDSAEGKTTADFCKKANVRYFEERDIRSTAIRSRIFEEAEASVALSMDPHVLLEAETIKRLIDYFDEHPDSKDLISGPMLYDCIIRHDASAKMDPVWRENMFGIWATDEAANDPDGEPFEIEMMGLGLFACRVDAWPGFHPLFKGFGGEEGYIHKKIRKAGGRCLCLPFLRWVHRFHRPRGINYPLIVQERISNYLIGWLELGIDPQEIIDHFAETQPNVPVAEIILPEIEELMDEFQKDPARALKKRHAKEETNVVPFDERKPEPQEWNQTNVDLGQPLRLNIKGETLLVRSFGLSWAND